MARPLKSQWDTADLFPTEEIRKVLTVSELNGSIRRVLEKEVGTVWVSGEISNLKVQPSGHVYFSLKDATSQVSCVMFRSEAQRVPEVAWEVGQKVIVHGQITVYDPRGQYQLKVVTLELRGIGALQAAFEKLKAKLQAEGLFEAARKRSLPKYPVRIGIATSIAGAALRDVLHVLGRRAPGIEVVIADCRVQGQGAAAEIACAIRWLNDWSASNNENKLDLILVTRGGGSLEDLWAFNEEPVARAIFNSTLPVISAVGHEIDFTIGDFVADLRAATPSAAAELISEGFFASAQIIANAAGRLRQQMRDHLDWNLQNFLSAQHRLRQRHPRRIIETQAQRVDELSADLRRCLRQRVKENAAALERARAALDRINLRALVLEQRLALNQAANQLRRCTKQSLLGQRQQLERASAQLRVLSPTSVLERGYSITQNAVTKEILRDADTVPVGTRLITRLAKGELQSQVQK